MFERYLRVLSDGTCWVLSIGFGCWWRFVCAEPNSSPWKMNVLSGFAECLRNMFAQCAQPVAMCKWFVVNSRFHAALSCVMYIKYPCILHFVCDKDGVYSSRADWRTALFVCLYNSSWCWRVTQSHKVNSVRLSNECVWVLLLLLYRGSLLQSGCGFYSRMRFYMPIYIFVRAFRAPQNQSDCAVRSNQASGFFSGLLVVCVFMIEFEIEEYKILALTACVVCVAELNTTLCCRAYSM